MQPSGVISSGADPGRATRRAAARDRPRGAALKVEAKNTPSIEITARANAIWSAEVARHLFCFFFMGGRGIAGK